MTISTALPRTKARPNSSRPNKKVTKVQKSQRQRIVESDIVDMLKMYHMEAKNLQQIAEKYGCSRQYVSKLLKAHDAPVSPKGVMVIYDSKEVLSRAGLDPFTRAKRLGEDAMQVCEVAVHLIKHELTCLNSTLQGGGSLKEQGIDTEKFIDKLTKFFTIAAPYVLERKDGKTTPDSTPDNQMHKLMNMKLSNPKSIN